MASPDKATVKSPASEPASGAPSSKKSARARRAAQEQARQRRQQNLLTIVAVTVLVGVVSFVFYSLRQNAATTASVTIPPEANTRYADFVSQQMVGTTAEGYQYLGKANATHTVEEIGSLSCPVCQAYHDSTFINILDEIKAGRAKFVFIPTTETGDYAVQTVTQGAYCAIQQNKFWEYQEVMYNWQPQYIPGGSNLSPLDPTDTGRLTTAAGLIGMDTGKFSSCINSQAAKDFVDKSNAYANSRGMTATPTIFIDGQLIYPLPSGQSSPDLNQMRGMLEAPAKQ
jgi:protein-disulfide isomerase